MTEKEKAKAYDEALEKAKEFYKGYKQRDNQLYADDLETIFPELRGGKEERTINCIGMCLTDANEQRFKDYGTTLKDCLAWLKKQGEHKDNNKLIWKHWSGCGVAGNGDGTQIYLIKQYNTYSICSCLSFECDYILLSDLDKLLPQRFEMKSAEESLDISSEEYNDIVNECLYGESKPADKVEPKFRVGDWVINSRFKNSRPIKIISISSTKGYELIGNENGDKEFFLSKTIVETEYHLWTIQDAKDGDVLCYKDEISLYKHDIKNCTKQETTFGGFVYHCCYDGKRFIMDSLYSLTEQDKIDIHPATKEQRDILFQKMREASYEWDAEKKELKTVEKKPQRVVSAEAKEALYDKPTDNDMVEALRTEYEKGRADAIAEMEKPTWSVEDMSKVQRICKYLDEAKKYYADITEVRECIDWLKSLKSRVIPQSRQEWSKEDETKMHAALAFIKSEFPKEGNKEIMEDTIEWLKSLKTRITWKPSDEQIEALGMATDICSIPENIILN